MPSGGDFSQLFEVFLGQGQPKDHGVGFLAPLATGKNFRAYTPPELVTS